MRARVLLTSAVLVSLLGLAHCGARPGRPRAALSPEVVAGWEHLNALRAAAGLAPCELDPELSGAAALHANYLELNEGRPEIEGLLAHQEFPGLPGVSPAGAQAGLNSVIAFGQASPTAAVDEWMGTLYHRIPLLRRELSRIGLAIGPRGVSVLTVELDAGAGAPVPYPHDGQTETPTTFPRGEVPEPRPSSWRGSTWGEGALLQSGYPITLTFGRDVALGAARGSVRSRGDEIEGAFSSPSEPARSDFPQGNVLAFLPRHRLPPGETISVVFEVVVDGVPERFTWSFQTVAPSEGPGPYVAGPAVAEGVVEHAHRMTLCDHGDVGCVGVFVLALATARGPLEVQVPESVAGERAPGLLELIGRRVRVTGEVRSTGPAVGIQLEHMDDLEVLPDTLPLVAASGDPGAHEGEFVWVTGTLGAPLPAAPGSPLFLPLDGASTVFVYLGADTHASLPFTPGAAVRVRGRLMRGQPFATSLYLLVSQPSQIEALGP